MNQKDLSIVKESVRKLYEASRKLKLVEKYANEVKKKEQLIISNFMFCNFKKGENTFDVTLDDGLNYYLKHIKLKVTRVTRKIIEWDKTKLKKVLGKETYSEIVDRTYTIVDFEGLTKYLKECGVSPKEFKKYIEIDEKLNEELLDDYYNNGKLDGLDISECYTVSEGSSYIKLTEQKND